MSLIVTGTIGIDTVYTPHGHVERVLGGSCTYFAAAASFYAPVRMVAAIGGDCPREFRDTIESFPGIDTYGLEVRPNSKTFAWGGKYHDNMNSRETLFTELGVLAEAPPKVPDGFRDSKIVFLANTHPGVQLQLLANFPGRTLAVADTMDLWINIAKPELMELFRKIDGVVLNNDEAELLTGKVNTVAAAIDILKLGPKFVILKKGEHGCLLAHKDGLAAWPAFPAQKVIDPTGAGDSFAGGMMGYLSSRLAAGENPGSMDNIRKSLVHGTVAASFTIEDFSLNRLKSLKKDDLQARYAQFARMLQA
jgi:sugar/nucleoside kinase (ribokinase family)